MKISNKQPSRSAQSWTNRAKSSHPPEVGYNSELRDWMQHVILEAEKNKDFKKKDQFLSLLKDLKPT
jgi:hypothetical protein